MRQSPSLAGLIAFVERRIMGRSLHKKTRTILHWSTELGLRALDTMLRSLLLLLPLSTPLREQRLVSCRTVAILVSASSDRLDRGSHRCSNSDCIGIVARAALDTIARRQKSIKPLDKIRVPGEKLRHSVYDARSVNTVPLLADFQSLDPTGGIRLTLEVFHNIKESVVNIWLIVELDFDLVEIGESILAKEKQLATSR